MYRKARSKPIYKLKRRSLRNDAEFGDPDPSKVSKNIRTNQIRNQIKYNLIKSNQIKSNLIKSNQIKSNQIKSDLIKSNQIKSNHGMFLAYS